MPDSALQYLSKLHQQVIKRTRRQFPAFPYEEDTIKELAKMPLSEAAYQEALGLWRDLAILHDQEHLAIRQGTAQMHHQGYTEILWSIAPLLLRSPFLTKEVAVEVATQQISWHACGRDFNEALKPFFGGPDILGLDYHKLWKSNKIASSYIALDWATTSWPAHRPLGWGLAMLDIPYASGLGIFFKKLKGSEIDEFFSGLDPQDPEPPSLLGALKLLKPAQWQALSKSTITKLLQMQNPEIRILVIGQAVGQSPKLG